MARTHRKQSAIFGAAFARRLACLGIAAGVGFAAMTAPSGPAHAQTCPSGGTARVDASCWPRLAAPIPRNAALEARITRLMDAMTLEDKVGQIIQADLSTVTPDDVRRYRLGSVLNGGDSGPPEGDRAPARAWLALADAFYDANEAGWAGRETIPILWGTDAVHGHNNIVGATLFPHNIGLGAARDPDMIRRIGTITAREVRVTGQEWTFAPTLAVAQDLRWGRSYESYSSDPALIAAYGTAMVEGLQGRLGTDAFLSETRVIATAKHFLGDGGTFGGKDQGDAQVSETVLRDVHGAGYVTALPAGAQTVMASFSSWQGAKLHGHRGLLTDVLKGQFGFDGFVVGDWNGHGQIPGCTNTDCPQTILAGVDMVMAPDSWRGFYDSTLRHARNGTLPMARLDDAVRRILRVKLRSGLFEAGRPSSRPLAGRFDLLGAPDHRMLAREAVRKSLVLLKNDGVLPLRAGGTVLVAGAGAHDMSRQTGGWTLSWQGTGNRRDHFPKAETIFEGIEAAARRAGGRAVLSVDGTAEIRTDAAIVVFGETPYAEFEGDLQDLAYQPGSKDDLALIRRLKRRGIPVVAVFLSGRPRAMDAEIDAADAFVAAWLPGSEGGGIADMLLAQDAGAPRYDFTGRLPFAWPREDRRGNRFARGYGLDFSSPAATAAAPSIPTAIEPRGVPPVPAGPWTEEPVFGPGADDWQVMLANMGGQPVPLGTGEAASTNSALLGQPFRRSDGLRAAAFAWTGQGEAAVAVTGHRLVQDLAGRDDLALRLEYRVDLPPAGIVTLNGRYDWTSQLIQSPRRVWQTATIPLRCMGGIAPDLPLSILTDRPLSVSLARASVVQVSATRACPDGRR